MKFVENSPVDGQFQAAGLVPGLEVASCSGLGSTLGTQFGTGIEHESGHVLVLVEDLIVN